jgi:hypothetical protein
MQLEAVRRCALDLVDNLTVKMQQLFARKGLPLGPWRTRVRQADPVDLARYARELRLVLRRCLIHLA